MEGNKTEAGVGEGRKWLVEEDNGSLLLGLIPTQNPLIIKTDQKKTSFSNEVVTNFDTHVSKLKELYGEREDLQCLLESIDATHW